MENKSVFSVLFDMSFTEFITTRMIKVLFIIGIIGASFSTLAVLVSGFKTGFFAGLLSLILAPVVFLFWVLLARVWCELIIVAFRIAENTGRLVEQGKTE